VQVHKASGIAARTAMIPLTFLIAAASQQLSVNLNLKTNFLKNYRFGQL